MKKLVKMINVVVLSSMIALSNIVPAAAASKNVIFYGKNGNQLKVSESKLSLYSNAVLIAYEPAEIYRYMGGTHKNYKAYDRTKTYIEGPVIVVSEFTAMVLNSQGKFTAVNMAYVQPVERLGKLNGYNLYSVDKSSNAVKNSELICVPRQRLSHSQGAEYVVGKNTVGNVTWTKSETIRTFFKNNNVVKFKTTIF